MRQFPHTRTERTSDVIIAGLQTANTAFVLQGGMIVGLLAVVVSDGIGVVGAVLVGRGRMGPGG